MSEQLYYVLDGSYSLMLNDAGELLHTYGIATAKKKYKIIATGCNLPSSDDSVMNDTILREDESGRIVFSRYRYLISISRCCPKCGHRL